MNKPLTKGEIDDIYGLVARKPVLGIRKTLERVLNSEAYWREAVRNVSIGGIPCPFCLKRTDVGRDHAPDCAYRIARDDER